MSQDFILKNGSYIPSHDFMDDLMKRGRPNEGMLVRYGIVVKSNFETQTVDITPSIPRQRKTVEELQQLPKLTAMVLQRRLSYRVPSGGTTDQFVADIEMPEVGAVVAYGYFSGVIESGITAYVHGEVFPIAGHNNYTQFREKLRALKDAGVVAFRYTKEGYYEKRFSDGKIVRGFESTTNLEMPVPVWEEERAVNGTITLTIKDSLGVPQSVVKYTSDGKFNFKSATDSIVQCLEDIADKLSTTTVNTLMGPMPLNTFLDFQTIKLRISALKAT